jgi:hypothetical protein
MTKEKMKAKFDKQIDDAKADLKRCEEKMKKDERNRADGYGKKVGCDKK